MLAKAEIDAVTVATPHFLHAEHAIEAASAGVAIISEKPMATTLAEADTILDAVDRNGVAYGVVHNYLFTLAMQAGFARRPEFGASIFGVLQGWGLNRRISQLNIVIPPKRGAPAKRKAGAVSLIPLTTKFIR